jgi:hypothetical protein
MYKEIKELGSIHEEYFSTIKNTILKYNLEG